VKASEVERRKRVERDLQAEISAQTSKGLAKRHNSVRVIDQMFQRQLEERERTVLVERELFAARLIQRQMKARLVRQCTEQLEREAMLKRRSSDMEARLEAQLKRQAAEAAVADKLTEASASLQRLEDNRIKLQKQESSQLMLRGSDGREQPLAHWMRMLMENLVRSEHSKGRSRHRALIRVLTGNKFTGGSTGIGVITVGKPGSAARGLDACLKLDKRELHERLSRGVDAIVSEVAACGDAEVQECLDYVLHRPAGSSPLVFPNSPYPRDSDADGLRADRKRPDGLGCVLEDFVHSDEACHAELTVAHVVALRLYSTAAFKALNAPLRDFKRTEAHPLAATVCLLAEGIKKLRALDTENRPLDLWRGMRNLSASGTFESSGGTEFALMSTTSDPVVAVKYALGTSSLLFKLRADSFMDRGADIAFLSAFPSEREYVFPPLTYLKPTGRTETIQIDAGEVGSGSPETSITVIEVQPHVV